jgi:ribonuclease BN (tRNA processing enzyme)
MRRLRRADGTAQDLGLEDYFDVRPLEEGQAAAIGPFSVEVRQTVHHIPCYAVKVRAGGRTLAYSADTSFDPGLVDWLADGSDIVIHETNLGTHTPYDALAALPASLRARMRLIHYPDGFDVERSAIECLRQGRVYEVRP